MPKSRGRAARPREVHKPRIARRRVLFAAALLGGAGALLWWAFDPVETAHAETITVWKSPTCGCCAEWVAYMRRKGYRLAVNNVADTVPMKQTFGIPDTLHSCHTSRIGEYIVEGHVPEPAVAKLMLERPPLRAIALPGMPPGSPGMDGPVGVYRVMAISADGAVQRFADVGV